MKMIRTIALALAAGALSTIALAGHSELQVPPADSFLLGGDQGAPMTVSGRNGGSTSVKIIARRGTSDLTIATVAPGGSFEHVFAVGETAVIRNMSSSTTASLSVDFTGSASTLSMTYALRQKN